MRQVVIRARFLLRRPAVLSVVLLLAAGGSLCVLLPLMGVPGFELSLLLTLATALLGGIVGAAAGFQEARLIQAREPRPKEALRHDSAFISAFLSVGAAFAVLASALAVPWVAAVVHSVLGSPCDPFAQAAFYPLLTLPTALLSAAAGVFAAMLGRRPGPAAFIYGLLLILSLVWTVLPIVNGPQVFAFNLFGGYFPGPLYDEALSVHLPLIWFRVETLLAVGALVYLCAFLLDMRQGVLTALHPRPGVALMLGLCCLGIFLMEDRGPELGLRMTDEYVRRSLGGLRESEHFVLAYPKEKSNEEVERTLRDLEFRHQQLSAFLGTVPKDRVHVYLYRSAEEKRALVGASHTQFAKPWLLSLHINDLPLPHPTVKHELTHVLAASLGSGPFKVTSRWGIPLAGGIVEGFAVAGDNPADELTLHEWAAAMRRQGLAPDVRKLMRAEGFYLDAAPRAYTAAGSFIRYLGDTYGKEKLATLYAHGDFDAAYGRPLSQLASEWEKFLEAVPLDEHAVNRAFARFRWQSLFGKPCAREVAELQTQAEDALGSDPSRALTLYRRCAQVQPQEPTFALGQATALERLGRAPEGDAVLRTLEKQVADRPALAAQASLARAELAMRQQDAKGAGEGLEKVLSLKPGPELERNAEIRLAALHDEKVGPAVWDYFKPGPGDLRLLGLQLAHEQAPDNAAVNYLLGRRLAQEGAPVLALKHLDAALQATLPEAVLREAWRLKLQAGFSAGDCNGVHNDMGHLPDLGAAFKAQAEEWRDRCDFEQQHFKNGPLVPKGAFR